MRSVVGDSESDMLADDDDVYRQISEDVRRIVSPLDDISGFRPVAGVGGHVREAHDSVHGASGRHRR